MKFKLGDPVVVSGVSLAIFFNTDAHADGGLAYTIEMATKISNFKSLEAFDSYSQATKQLHRYLEVARNVLD